MKYKIYKGSIIILVVYLTLGIFYIIFSDKLVFNFFHEVETLTKLQTIKGMGFILVSGLIISLLVNREIHKTTLSTIMIKNQNTEYEALYDLYYAVNSELTMSEEKFKTYIQSSPISIFIIGQYNNIGFVNYAACKLTGYDEKELSQKKFNDLLSQDISDIDQKKLASLQVNGKLENYESKLITRNEKVIDIMLDIVRLSEDQTIAFIKNITDLKEIQRQLAATNNEYLELNTKLEESIQKIKEINHDLEFAKNKAEENDALKSSFLNNLNHEIRTPLNGILGFANLLDDDDYLPDKTKEYISIIKSSSHQLLRIMGDILDISRIETGQIKLAKEILSLNEVMHKVYTLVVDQVNEKGKQIVVKSECYLETGEDIIVSDEERLSQILISLASNANKFTHNGEIAIGYILKGDFIEFYIKDSGIGIPEDKYQIIFERFRQLEVSTTRIYGGTGVGLSIAKGLVELLGGNIWLESSLGKGSTFYFTIPYIKTDKALSKKNVSIGHDVLLNRTILIAEDQQESFELLKEYFSGLDVHIIHARNGAEAVDLTLSGENVDLVLMDIRIPVVDGLAATRAIKAVKPNLPVIAQTAYATNEDKEACLAAGCDDYITKPIDQERLLTMLSKYLK